MILLTCFICAHPFWSIFIYLGIAFITYVCLEYSDLNINNKGEVYDKTATDYDKCPNSLIAILWPLVLCILIVMGPTILGTKIARFLKKAFNAKKLNKVNINDLNKKSDWV